MRLNGVMSSFITVCLGSIRMPTLHVNSVIKGSFYKGIIVKYHGKRIWEPQHHQINVIMRCVIKRMHCMSSFSSG